MFADQDKAAIQKKYVADFARQAWLQ
jgi:hypothetical protein